MKMRVKEVDIRELTKTISGLFGYAIGTYDILFPYIQKTSPKIVISVSETYYNVLVGYERGDVIAEFGKWWGLIDINVLAEIIAEKFNMESVIIVYGEWDTLLIFY